MNGESAVGWIILIGIAIAGGIFFWKGSDYVETPHSAVVFFFGRIVAEKTSPGWFWLPPLPFIWAEHVDGAEHLVTVESDKVTMFDMVKAHLRVFIRYTRKRRVLRVDEGDSSKSPRGFMEERSAILALTSLELSQLHTAIESAVISTGEEVLRSYRSTQVGDPKVLKKLKKEIGKRLDEAAGTWGIDVTSVEIQELEVGRISEAAERSVAARFDADTRAEDARGLERIIKEIRDVHGHSKDADRMVEAVTLRFKLESVPKGTNLTGVSLGTGDVLGALEGLFGEKLGEASDRVRGKTAQARKRYGK